MYYQIRKGYKEEEKVSATPKEIAELVLNGLWKNYTYHSSSKYCNPYIMENGRDMCYGMSMSINGTDEEIKELEKLLFRKIKMVFDRLE